MGGWVDPRASLDVLEVYAFIKRGSDLWCYEFEIKFTGLLKQELSLSCCRLSIHAYGLLNLRYTRTIWWRRHVSTPRIGKEFEMTLFFLSIGHPLERKDDANFIKRVGFGID